MMVMVMVMVVMMLRMLQCQTAVMDELLGDLQEVSLHVDTTTMRIVGLLSPT